VFFLFPKTGAIYPFGMGMKTLLLEGKLFGGKALATAIVENFPRFPEGISGAAHVPISTPSPLSNCHVPA